jgi:uncharacterized protein (DUF952 family)
VHCSDAAQVVATAGRYYAGRTDLVLLEIDPQRLSAAVIEEPSASTGELFPHIYGTIERSAVVAEHAFVPGPDGTFALPAALRHDA